MEMIPKKQTTVARSRAGRRRKKAPGDFCLWLNRRLPVSEFTDYVEETVLELRCEYFRARNKEKKQAISWQIRLEVCLLFGHRLVHPFRSIWAHIVALEVHEKVKSAFKILID